MSLIKSISGIRGTIGGKPNQNLTPIDAVKFATAYAVWLQERHPNKRLKVVVGRDARISGKMVSSLVLNTLVGMGIDVVNVSLSTTPTVEVAVTMEQADGGIIITASHNPKQWNALKLLNEKGEFINDLEGKRILEIADNESFEYAFIDDLGTYDKKRDYMEKHIDLVLKLKLVDVEAVKNAKFKVVVDAVNSSGGVVIPQLLEKMGVEVVKLYCEPNGEFPHNPEPLKEHLTDISELVVAEKADLGIVVDPDVDRLALVNEDGSMFGEEYTLVAVADYILSRTPGNTVSNLSSSRALRDVTEKYGQKYTASAVGEVNVVSEMKAQNAVIGGEGNGGIIYPESHYGRDSLVGVALFLTHLAKSGKTCLQLRKTYPDYYMSKNKIELTDGFDVDGLLEKFAQKHQNESVNTIDGVKIDFATEWVHLRKSNTEPIIRIYTESQNTRSSRCIGFENFVGSQSIGNLVETRHALS
jgi:phosphomannomutase